MKKWEREGETSGKIKREGEGKKKMSRVWKRESAYEREIESDGIDRDLRERRYQNDEIE